MTTRYVSDEVWNSLDPAAGRLSRSTRIKVALWCVLAAAFTFVVLIVAASGLVIHRFTVAGGGSGGSIRSCWQTMSVTNNGWFDERVVTATLHANGTGATLARGLRGSSLPSGATRDVRVNYSGQECRQLFDGFGSDHDVSTAPDLVLRLHRPWGTSTATIRLESTDDDVDGVTVHW